MFRERYGTPTALVAAGGVAANQAIRKRACSGVAFEAGIVLVAPPPELCTDNGAMIAWAGAERLALGLTDPLDFAPRARWPLDEVAGPTTQPAPTSQQGAKPHEHSTASRCSAAAPGARRSPMSAARAGRKVTLWARDPANADAARSNSARAAFLPRRAARRRHRGDRAISREPRSADAILLVVPAQALRVGASSAG